MQLAVSCPHCEARPVQTANEVWQLHPTAATTPFGAHRVVGCVPCVRAQVAASAARTLRSGWFRLPWGLLTPVVLAQNLVAWFAPGSAARVRQRLEAAGLSVEELEVGPDGLSRAERRLADGVVYVLSLAIHADGEVDGRELAYAIRIAAEVVGEGLSLAELETRLTSPPDPHTGLEAIDAQGRFVLLRAAVEIAMIDGRVTDEERVALHALAERLGSAPMVADLLLTQLAPSQAVTREQRRAEAAERIGVPAHASVAVARAAYERALLRIHEALETEDVSIQAALAAELVALQQAWRAWTDEPDQVTS